jgi:hypothetical protein
MERQATAAEVRAHYKAAGHIAHISREGHVLYKQDGKGPWLEGRWVDEYRVSEEYGVRLA